MFSNKENKASMSNMSAKRKPASRGINARWALVLTLLALLLSTTAPAWGDFRAAASSTSSAAAAPAAPDVSGDWPTFGHDNQRTSYNAHETLITTDTVSRLAPAWRRSIDYDNRRPASNPVTSHGIVYAGSSSSSGPNLYAFDQFTGEPIWSRDIGHGSERCFNIGVGSTASISGTVLTIGGDDGAYYGIDALSGDQLWRHAIGAGSSSYAWTSPLMVNGRALIGIASNCDNPQIRGEIRNLNESTGAVEQQMYTVPVTQTGGTVWQPAAINVDGSIIAMVTGEEQNNYAGEYARAFVTLDPDTFTVTGWDQRGSPGRDHDWGTAPTIFHDAAGRELVGANHKDGFYYAYLLNDVGAGPVWSTFVGHHVGLNAAFDPSTGEGGSLYVPGHYSRDLYSLDPATGDMRWYRNVGDWALWGHLAVANGMIFLNEHGIVHILDAQNGALLRTLTPQGAVGNFTGVTISHGYLYWIAGDYLNAWTVGPYVTPTVTPTQEVTPSMTPTVTKADTATETAESTSTATATGTAVACQIEFSDVPVGSTFYPFVRCMACRGIITGYAIECETGNPCFRPASSVTRGQLSKIVANSAGFSEPATGQQYEDVPEGSTFYEFIWRLTERDLVNGYTCGGVGEPCSDPALPYFRSNNNVTRGQLAKIVANGAGLTEPVTGQQYEDVAIGSTFYEFIGRLTALGVMNGYTCGGVGEPCGDPELPYFRLGASATRGQASKIVANMFFPGCVTAK